MTTAYLLAFALSVTPYLAYLVGMVCFGLALTRDNAPADRPRLPVWPLAGFSLFAFALGLWQQLALDDRFGLANFDVDNVWVLGVSIPLELGRRMHDLVNGVFYLLLMAGVIVSLILGLFRTQRVSWVPRWVARLISLAFIALLSWASWPLLTLAIKSWQYLF